VTNIDKLGENRPQCGRHGGRQVEDKVGDKHNGREGEGEGGTHNGETNWETSWKTNEKKLNGGVNPKKVTCRIQPILLLQTAHAFPSSQTCRAARVQTHILVYIMRVAAGNKCKTWYERS
jgi:hypothetical protein